MQQTEDNHSKQPFYVIEDEAHARIYATLSRGEVRFVKSYLGICPETCKCKCNCKFYLNFLKDGKMVRSVNGELKDVFSLTEYEEKQAMLHAISFRNVAIGGIYDSEYMNYVCDNVASKRIKFLRKKCDISVTMVTGFTCRKCNTALEPHLMIEHLDINHCVHKCENGHKRK